MSEPFAVRVIVSRLYAGRCPVHDHPMTRTSKAGSDGFREVRCRMHTCSVAGIADGASGPVYLFPEWQHLVTGKQGDRS
jgi:hypothetical protein